MSAAAQHTPPLADRHGYAHSILGAMANLIYVFSFRFSLFFSLFSPCFVDPRDIQIVQPPITDYNGGQVSGSAERLRVAVACAHAHRRTSAGALVIYLSIQPTVSNSFHRTCGAWWSPCRVPGWACMCLGALSCSTTATSCSPRSSSWRRGRLSCSCCLRSAGGRCSARWTTGAAACGP